MHHFTEMYRVLNKVEMLFAHVLLPLSCYRKTSEFIAPQLWPPNSPDLNPVDYSVWDDCKKRCTKHASVIWMN